MYGQHTKDLDKAREQLEQDLSVLKMQLNDDEKISVISDGIDLVVFAPERFKAYIPKTYKSFIINLRHDVYEETINLDDVIYFPYMTTNGSILQVP